MGRRPRAAEQHYAFHQLSQRRGSFWTNDAPWLRRRQSFFGRQCLFAAPQFGDNLWLIKQSTVSNRRNRTSELQRRDANFLTHRDGADRNRLPVFEPRQPSATFIGQLDAGNRAKTKCAYVFVEFRSTEPQRDLDGAHVARFRENVRNRQQAKWFVIADAMAGDVNGAVLAIEYFIG